MKTRDDFTNEVKHTIAARAGNRCSNPECRASTHGPQEDPTGSINVGVAAHICAAAPGGPRYDATMSSEQRGKPENGIWLCQTHAKLIDNDTYRYSVDVLQRWKTDAERQASLLVGKPQVYSQPNGLGLTDEERELLCCAYKGQGNFFLMRPDYPGDWIRAGSRDFLDMADPSVAAIYLDAFKLLMSRALIQNAGGTLYKLTGDGFKLAAKLCP